MTPAYVPAGLRRQVRADAGARCGYCHSPEAFLGMPLDIEHLVPEAAGGGTVRENLWLACSRCNDFKGDRTAEPRVDQVAVATDRPVEVAPLPVDFDVGLVHVPGPADLAAPLGAQALGQ